MTIFVNLNASGSGNGASWNDAFTDLQSAINAAKSGDEIWVAKGTYTLANSLEIKDKVKIYGGFAAGEAKLTERKIKNNLTTLSGNNQFTVVKFTDKAGTATLDGFTIQDGNSNDDGGGVYNDGDLTLKNVVVRNNKADDDGGGIRNNGKITIVNSTIADNTSGGTSQFSGGGGLINTGESATIINSTFSGNTAKNGGAIRNDKNLELINSTLSGNTATQGGGGAIANSIGNVVVTNSTITKNTAAGPGAGIFTTNTVTVTNSIVAQNIGNKDIFAASANGSNRSFISGGNNLIGNGEGTTGFSNGTNGDKVGTQANPIDPLLDALKDNGGATQTHALLDGSPAINAGNNNNIAEDKADLDADNNRTEKIPFEQRGEGFERVVDGTVDIGAVESKAKAASNPSTNIIINEILADPDSTNGDANGDGNVSTTEDEFVELINNSSNAIDISGWTLSDSVKVRHTFPEDTIVPANGVIVVFSGGTPTGNFGGAIVQTASTGSFSLNNDGDTVTLSDGINQIASYTYGDEGGKNQSLTRDPDLTGSFVLHSQATNSGGALFSPGTKINNTTPPPTTTPGIAIAQSDNTTNVTEGGATDTYTVVLNSKPTDDVTVTISNNGETTTDLTTLTFTTDNWNTAQTVTVTAIDDNKVENEHNDTITHAVTSSDTNYNGINADQITVNITDNDVQENNPTPTLTPLTPGKDKFFGTVADDKISSGAGNDFLKGEAGNDVFDAGADNDRVYGGVGNDTISGGTGNDYLNGGKDNDFLDGGEGNDRLYGGDGNDTLIGGAGNDYLNGGNGNDVLDGNADNDRIYGDAGEDTLTGGTGNDYLNGGIDRDSLDGGAGNDRLYGGDGNDTLIGGAGNDFLKGGDGEDLLDGGEGNDRLYGGDLNDTLIGGSGNDLIYGGNGNDAIAGFNIATFGVGEIDRLRGNAGEDTFILGDENRTFYNDGDNTKSGKSDYAIIEDFNQDEDLIQLSFGEENDYYLGAIRGGTGIYIDDDGVSGLSHNDELIGLIRGVSLNEGMIKNIPGFSFAGFVKQA